MFLCVLYYFYAFGPFGCLTKLNAKRAELVQKFVPRSRVLSFRIKHTRLSLLGPKLIFWCVCTIWVHLEPFGCLTKLGAKRAELLQKFVPRSRIGIFRNESTRSTSFYPKLMFWCVSYYWGAFGRVWLRNNTKCKTGQTGEKLRAMKSHRKFSQRTHPINPIGP